jgi:ParB family chromosome partitioning protein
MPYLVSRYDDVDIDNLIIDRFQVRTTNVSEGVDDLAESIKEFGLLQPIIICPAERHPGKWEVVSGQRRLLAHKKLGWTKIRAGFIERTLTLDEGTAVSANENVHQMAMSRPDLVDLCERLYVRYGTLSAVAEKTKIPYHVVRAYVRLARLDPALKAMVENHEVELDLAVKAQDAASAAGEFNKDEAMKLLEVLKRSDNDLRKRILEVKKNNPTMDLNAVQAEAEKPAETVNVRFTLQGGMASAIRKLASQKGSDTNTAAMDLVEDQLRAQGLLEETD